MKNVILLFSLCVLVFSCEENGAAPAAEVQSVDLTGFEITELPNGFQRVYRNDITGKSIEEGVMKNGKRNGTWVVYQDKRPVPKSIANFIDDEYSGVYMEFSSTGQLELICNYRASQLHGKFVRIKNTRLLEEGYYVDGQIDGAYKKFYPNKDILQQEIYYTNGQLDGASNYFNEEGEIVMKYEYKDGEKVSGGMVERNDESKK